jgi:hypothetical protein
VSEPTDDPKVAFALGAATLVASIFIGKVLVDAVQGQLPPPPRGAPGPLDQSVRFVGSLAGISVTLLQLPRAWEAAQDLLQKV